MAHVEKMNSVSSFYFWQHLICFTFV